LFSGGGEAIGILPFVFTEARLLPLMFHGPLGSIFGGFSNRKDIFSKIEMSVANRVRHFHLKLISCI